MPFAGAAGVLYSAWAIGLFFEKRKMTSYLKALIAYILGMITFWIFPVIIGTLVDLLNKN